MKYKIKIILIIIFLLAISTLIYCFTIRKYRLPQKNLIGNNLYKFKITKDYEEIISIKESKNYLYILTSEFTDTDITEKEYKILKYNIETAKVEKENTFKTEILTEPIIIIDNDHIKVISNNNINIHKFDKNLEYKSKSQKDVEENTLYGEYKNNLIFIKDNKIFLKDKLYDTVLKTCGKSYNIIYKENTYVYFNNDEINVSCLYNINKKTTEYFDNSNIEPFSNGYMLYNLNDNKIIIKKTNEEKYYLNSKDEIPYVRINDEGNKILTFNDNTKEFKVYDIEQKKIINKLKLNLMDEEFVPLLIINDLVYIVTTNGVNYDLYIWNYNKDTLSEDMITYNNTKDKIDSYELTTKIKDELNVNVYIYDKGVRYFNDFYALPSYDDELTYDKLNKTYEILNNFNKDFFDNFKYKNNNGLEIYLTDKVAPSDLTTQIENPSAYSLVVDGTYIIAMDINNSDYEKTLCHELMHSIENNMYYLYTNDKIKNEPFNEWNKYNPKDFNYNNSYVDKTNDKYTISSGKDIYFIDSYAHTYPSEDRARIFEQFCSNENLFEKYANIKKKAEYIKKEIEKVYPTIKDSKVFDKLSSLDKK